MILGLFKMLSTKCVHNIYLINVYKQDLALNNQQWLICHKTKPNQFSVSIQPTLTILLHIINFHFIIISMPLFCAAIKRDAVHLLRFPFPRLLMCNLSIFLHEISLPLFFFSFLFSDLCYFFSSYVAIAVNRLCCNWSFFALFNVFLISLY